MSRIEVAVLGPPHVTVDGVAVPLVGRSLALAVRLAIAGQRPVSLHRLADVWPQSMVSDGAIRVALTRLRHAMGPHAVVRVEHGYLLAPSAHLDADRFDELVGRARERSRDPDERIAAVEEGLRLWTGAAYDGFERSSWVEYEAIRLDEMREHAIDLRFELVVERGVDDAIIGEMASALARAPERERRCELLALALYRAGRQSSGLEVIAATRRRLRDEFGLNLGDAVVRLERRILDHDPTLMTARDDDDGAPARDPRLRSAAALMREGIVGDALTISGEALVAARAAGHRPQLADALLVRAQAVSLTGHEDPNPLVDEAQAIGRALGDGRLLARAAIVRFGSGVPQDRTQAMIELGEPLDFLPNSAPERIELLCAAAVIVTFVDLDTAVDRVLGAARRTYEAVGDARSEAVWLAAQSIVRSVHGGDGDTADELAERARSVSASIDDPAISTVVIHAELRTAYSVGHLERVDQLIDTLEVVAQRAVLPFGIVRAHLCRITNAMARGELAGVPGLIEQAVDVGRRLSTHASGPATHSQLLALALEQDRLGEHLDGLRATARATPNLAMSALAAYAGDDADLGFLRQQLADARPDTSFPIAVALVALAAAERGDAEAAQWARPYLMAFGDRTIFVGFGTVGLGFARLYVGLTDRVLGNLDAARASFEAAVDLSERSGGLLWCAHARLWLAETLLDLGDEACRAEAARQVELAQQTGVFAACARVAGHARRLGGRLVESAALESLPRS